MERYLGRNIKDVIAEFPGVETVLAGYGVGCASCEVGTCLLRDIIKVHGLSAQQEAELMRGIAAVIFPGEAVAIPPIARKAAPRLKAAGFSPPVKALVDEHVLIRRLLAMVPWIVERLGEDPEAGFAASRTAVEFIRGYADRFHHAKEEDILFGYFAPDLDILISMRKEHDIARGHVRELAAAIEARDAHRAAERIAAYGSLLAEHIRKEDEVLYPFLDSRLTMSQVGEMFSRFAAVERQFGEAPRLLGLRIAEMEEKARAAAAPTG